MAKEEVLRKIRKYFELNENQNTPIEMCVIQLKQCLRGNLWHCMLILEKMTNLQSIVQVSTLKN